MKPFYKKISIIAYINVLIIIGLELVHNQLMNISESLLFGILLLYALLNGWYIQTILYKQKKFEQSLVKEKMFSDQILNTISSGIIIIDEDHSIVYYNQMSQILLEERLDIGLDVITLNNALRVVIDGVKPSGIRPHQIKVEASGVHKHLLVFGLPFENGDKSEQVLLYMENVTDTILLNEKLEKQYLNMFKSFVKFIDAKDTYTGLHSLNVTEYVDRILSVLDIGSDEKEKIKIAANLHDIGKVGIPENILNKPGRLTEAEFSKMKEHPVIGEGLISEIEGYKDISRIIRHHHEKYNGTGYSDQMIGEEIPLGSRIIAVADAFDAITTDRVYQEKRTLEEGLQILINEKGKQFDPTITEIFLDIMKKSH